MSEFATKNLDLHSKIGPAGSHFDEIDAAAAEDAVYWNEEAQGYWVINRYDDIMKAALDPVTFSNHSIVAVDPEPEYRFLPSSANPPILRHYRQPVATWFSAKRVESYRDELRAIANEIIDGFIDAGEGDFLTLFGDVFPVLAFCRAVGASRSDVELFSSWQARLTGDPLEAGDPAVFGGVMREINEYWSAKVADRRANPRDPSDDFLSHLLEAKVDGEPIVDEDVLDICMTTTVGSMDTTKSTLGWCFYHFATHDDDRHWVTRDADIIPSATEELLRVYPIVSMARRVDQDTDFGGCPMKKGDIALLNYQAGNRDPEQFDDPTAVRLDRKADHHLAFGRSGHRCLGLHLARAEIQVAIEEWHKRIPEYRIASDEPLMAHGGQVSLMALPLSWA